MPKTITPALDNHLDQEVTTLSTCWKIVRKDGQQFFFTDHDQDIVYQGDRYEAESSYRRTAMESGTDMSVSNIDVDGILDSDKIREEELRAGLFNRAEVFVFMLNWADPSQGELKLKRGWLGEVQLKEDGTFMTEIRGLAQALTHNWIEVYSGECRADFCDERCKLNIADYTHRGTVSDRGDGRTIFEASDIPDAPTTSTSVGAHRWWSFKPETITNGVSFELAQLRFYDQDQNRILSGSPNHNIPRNLGPDNPNRLWDGKYHTTWGFDTIKNDENDDDEEDIDLDDVRWWIDFGTPVDVFMIEIIAKDAALAPTSFFLQYSNSEPVNASFWTTAKSCSHVFTVDGESALFALGSPSAAPISIATSPSSPPAPVEGASSYVGGTITWVTGKNAGRVSEIVAYDNDTNEVTLFDSMPYAIEVGDMFDIAQGCDKTLSACVGYENVINRRAEDYVPGNDEFMSYPDAN